MTPALRIWLCTGIVGGSIAAITGDVGIAGGCALAVFCLVWGITALERGPVVRLRKADERERTEFEDCLFSPLPTAEPREARRDEGVRH